MNFFFLPHSNQLTSYLAEMTVQLKLSSNTYALKILISVPSMLTFSMNTSDCQIFKNNIINQFFQGKGDIFNNEGENGCCSKDICAMEREFLK